MTVWAWAGRLSKAANTKHAQMNAFRQRMVRSFFMPVLKVLFAVAGVFIA